MLRFLLLLTAGISGCSKESAPEVSTPVVTVTQATEAEVQDWDEFTGRLAAPETVEIRARVSGYITEIKFKDGDIVTKGQPLFLIDSRTYQADYDQADGACKQAEATLTLAKSDYERARQLREKGVLAAADFDDKAATYSQALGSQQSAKSALESARLNLEFCTVTSPIEGKVSKANVTVGNLVSADSGTVLTEVISINPIYVYTDIDEQSFLRYIRYFQSKKSDGSEDGQLPMQIRLQDEENFLHEGKVDFIDNRVDATTGTISLRGVFENSDYFLVPGIYVRIKIPSGDPFQATLIPQRAIGSSQGQKYAALVGEDNIVAFSPVTTGREINGNRVIKSGLNPGDTVIVDGLLKVQAGTKVDPQPLEAETTEAPTSPQE